MNWIEKETVLKQTTLSQSLLLRINQDRHHLHREAHRNTINLDRKLMHLDRKTCELVFAQ